MAGFRARLWIVLASALVVVAVHGQTPASSGFTLIEGLGLPAVDAGALRGEPQSSNLLAMKSRGALRAAMAAQARVGTSGLTYMRGRVIVKFRAGSPAAAASVRPDYVDFDEIAIDPNEDAEAVAARFRERADVEYAQPAYVMHPMLVPNDQYYKELQWNLPLIDLERAWDIQPQAGGSITVAVIDTGVAYMNATIVANIRAFRDDRGNLYPAIPNATIPYSAAPQLGASDRFVAPRDFTSANAPLDFDGHGTHVSGTIGQLTNDGIGTAGIA